MHIVKIEIRECVKHSLTRGLKHWKIINRQAQKVVAVAYRRWSFTRGFNCKALTGKILAFWIGGRLWEVVAYERWSHMEVQLYMYFSDTLNASLILYFICKTNHDIGLLLLCLLFVPVCQYSANSSSKADHLIPAAL